MCVRIGAGRRAKSPLRSIIVSCMRASCTMMRVQLSSRISEFGFCASISRSPNPFHPHSFPVPHLPPPPLHTNSLSRPGFEASWWAPATCKRSSAASAVLQLLGRPFPHPCLTVAACVHGSSRVHNLPPCLCISRLRPPSAPFFLGWGHFPLLFGRRLSLPRPLREFVRIPQSPLAPPRLNLTLDKSWTHTTLPDSLTVPVWLWLGNLASHWALKR